jgi:16S rRNA (adenine1518-N6/adenine1519-N6)-dimethyltransferase
MVSPPAGSGRLKNKPMSSQRPSLPRVRKRFGQHFLVDTQVLEAIAALGTKDQADGDRVVEIGPGRGALTRPLLSRVDRLVAIEIDRDLVAHLRDNLTDQKLHLIEGDVLSVDLDALAADEGASRLLVVGNLPYNISAPVLFKLRDHAHLVRRAVLTLQKEVAERLVAAPGGRQYSLVTVLLEQCAHMEIHQTIPPSAFHPVPKVDSAVLEIRFEPQRVAVQNLALFERVVRAAFSLRRKMLRNSLQPLIPTLQARGLSLEDMADEAQIDLTQRAENLSVDQYATLTRVIDTAG